MIFVSVGTHEQQFNRLVKAVDDLVASGTLAESVFIQAGYSDYEPEHCEWAKFVPATEMSGMMRYADVVVTHGGPSSFIEAMAAGKAPVVVPRRADLGEHVNNHQVEFVRFVTERMGGIVPCFDIAELSAAIEEARQRVGASFDGHNAEFCNGLQELIKGL